VTALTERGRLRVPHLSSRWLQLLQIVAVALAIGSSPNGTNTPATAKSASAVVSVTTTSRPPTTVPPTKVTADYLSTVDRRAPALKKQSNKTLLSLGETTCKAFSVAGVPSSVNEMLTLDASGHTFSYHDLGVLVSSAAYYLCPKYYAAVVADGKSLETEGTTTTTTTTGDESGPQFTVPARDSGWNEVYTFNCASTGQAGNFITSITGYGSAADTDDGGANQLELSGSGTNHYYDTGTFSITVESECYWTEEAVSVP
jgi:hypothetical protein